MKYFSITTQNKKDFSVESISYALCKTAFGTCIVATADKGVVAVLFGDTKKSLVEDLKTCFTVSVFREEENEWIRMVQHYIEGVIPTKKIPLQLVGTVFQLQVWKALMEIGSGTTCNYGVIAEKIGDKKKSRAVGTAIGANPIGFIVPCHRVLRSDGGMGGYRWGIERKQTMLASEVSKK